VVLTENPIQRIDAKYFAKNALAAEVAIKAGNWVTLNDVSRRIESFGAYALNNEFEYQEEGIPFLRCVNIKSGFVDFGDSLYVDEQAHQLLSKSAVKPGMVLITMSGRVGDCAVALDHWNYPINSNQDIAKLTPSGIDPFFLTAFMGSSFGVAQIERMPIGSIQQHIFLWMIQKILIRRFNANLEARIASTVEKAYSLFAENEAKVAEAEATLLAALGLAGWSPPEPLSYTARAADALTAARLDAQFYAPRIRALLDVLGRDGRKLSDIAKPRRDRFSAKKCDTFHYIEIGDVEGGGGLSATFLDSADAPSRATWHVRKGDVLTSTVRPIRRLSAIVAPDQDRYVASSGFAVLQPTGVTPEVLMTFLRLPVICELMDLYGSASMYPAISESDILGLPIPVVTDEVADIVTAAVQSAFAARARSRALLSSAKRAVEIAIEDGEAAALAWLDEAAGAQQV
jgi:hypothetical protein